MNGASDPHRMLGAAIAARFAPAHVELREGKRVPWFSATFSGMRHHYDLVVRGEGAQTAAARFVSEIKHDDIEMRGHLLADIDLVRADVVSGVPAPMVMLGIDALTVAVR